MFASATCLWLRSLEGQMAGFVGENGLRVSKIRKV